MKRADAIRELDKVIDVLRKAVEHHQMRDESNAALHMSDTVRKTPLTVALEGALADSEDLRADINSEGVEPI